MKVDPLDFWPKWPVCTAAAFWQPLFSFLSLQLSLEHLNTWMNSSCHASSCLWPWWSCSGSWLPNVGLLAYIHGRDSGLVKCRPHSWCLAPWLIPGISGVSNTWRSLASPSELWDSRPAVEDPGFWPLLQTPCYNLRPWHWVMSHGYTMKSYSSQLSRSWLCTGKRQEERNCHVSTV